MRSRVFQWLLFVAFLAISSAAAMAEVRISQVFGDNMVLQRDQPVPVWGWADPGEQITVTFAGQTKKIIADAKGNWRATLDAMPASAEPRDLVAQSSKSPRRVKFANILVGEVWLLSGDFGVYYETFACANADKEIPAANHPNLRMLKVWAKSSNEPLHDILGEWRVSTPENVRGFSGLGYFFGRALNRELKVPIGVIDASYRYSYPRNWMPHAAFKMIPELSKPRERMESWDSTTPTGKAAFATSIAQVEAWLPKAQQAFQSGKPIPDQPVCPAPLTATDQNYLSISELSLQYQGMIHPLIPMRIRGVIFSIGESSCLEPAKLFFYLKGLVESWRQAWGQGDFPFYFELLPQVNTPATQADSLDSWAVMRMEQLKALSLPNTAAAVTYDVSDYVSDGRNRQDPGERFARIALATEYGRKLIASGPTYRLVRFDGVHAVVTYTNVGSGLIVGEKKGLLPLVEVKGGALKGFAIAGPDMKWHWAEAKIVGETVELRSPQVPQPRFVRYACSANPVAANLYNRDGLPAVPFRTDER